MNRGGLHILQKSLQECSTPVDVPDNLVSVLRLLRAQRRHRQFRLCRGLNVPLECKLFRCNGARPVGENGKSRPNSDGPFLSLLAIGSALTLYLLRAVLLLMQIERHELAFALSGPA
jgi:hypothetical protein